MAVNIKHVWFDFSETIASLNKERHDRLRYESYAEVTKRSVNEELIAEYKNLYEKFNHSNAAIFHSLSQPAGYWSKRINSVDPRELFELTEASVPEVLKKLNGLVPISLFSNIDPRKILSALNIDSELFAHILTAEMVKSPKPALDGFYKLIELSGVSPREILYIGDDVEKDARPAKQVGVQFGLMWKKSNEADYSFDSFRDILNLF